MDKFCTDTWFYKFQVSICCLLSETNKPFLILKEKKKVVLFHIRELFRLLSLVAIIPNQLEHQSIFSYEETFKM